MPRIRIAVTGSNGQVVRSLVERAAGMNADVTCIGRPALDLGNPDTIESALASITADVLVSAAAYTDVNKAEAEPDLAGIINGRAPALLAARANGPSVHDMTTRLPSSSACNSSAVNISGGRSNPLRMT